MSEREELCKALFACGVIKFGSFTLKSGVESPIYLDMKNLVSHPKLLKQIALLLHAVSNSIRFDRIAGIPYGAIPIATALSLESGWPMIYTRKELKDYGTKKQVEGEFREGETVLVIDDLITQGHSKFEAIAQLEKTGLVIKDVVVLIDRQQGGKEELARRGYSLHSVITIAEILSTLQKEGLISSEQVERVRSFLENQRK